MTCKLKDAHAQCFLSKSKVLSDDLFSLILVYTLSSLIFGLLAVAMQFNI